MHLGRLTLILEIVGQKQTATVADICAHTDLPKPTVYRLVQDLAGAGLLESAGKGQVAIGARLRSITRTDRSDAALLDVIAPHLRTAAVDHGLAFFLARRRGQAVEIIRVETPDTGVSYLHPGLGKRPLHACSCSKVIAAFSTDLIHSGQTGARLRAYTFATTTQVETLRAEFEIIRDRGFAECVEEIERGMCSVAVPMATSGFGATLAIGATGSARILDAEKRPRIAAALASMARDLAAALAIERGTNLERSA